MAAKDFLYKILKSAYPDSADEDIQSEASNLANAPGQALHSALSFIPGFGLGEQVADANPEMAGKAVNAIKNSNTVKDATEGILGDGNPISGLSSGLVKGAAKDLFQPAESDGPDEGPGPDEEEDATPAPTPTAPTPTPDDSTPASPAPAAPSKGAPAAKPDALKSLLQEQTNPNNDDAAIAAAAKKKREMGILPVAAAGIGDAISSAASAFGAQGVTGNQDKVEAGINNSIDKDKALFEEKQRKDPTSDVSRHYQKVLSLMLGDHAKDMNVSSMSAENIASTLPEVEKYMQKELGLKQIQATKELSMENQRNNERDRLWNQATQSLNSVRGDKSLVQAETMRDGAISALQAINHIQSEGRAPNKFEYVDLLGQLWKARTGASLTNEELKNMDAKTMQATLGPVATYFSGDPKAATSPQATNALKNFVIQSGKTADQLHDQYMQTRGINAAGSRLKEEFPEDYDRLTKMSRGMSFADALNQSNTPAKENSTNKPPLTAFYK